MSSPNSKAWTRESGTSTHLRDSPYQQPSMVYGSETVSGDQVTPQSAGPRRPRRHHRSPSVANTFPAQSDKARRPSRDHRHHQDYPNDTAAIATNEEITTRARIKRPSTNTRTHRARSSGRRSSPARVSNPRTSSRNATHYREPTNSTAKVPSTERAPNPRPSRSARAETRVSGGRGHHDDRSGDSCFSACCIISSALCGCGGGGDGGGGGGE